MPWGSRPLLPASSAAIRSPSASRTTPIAVTDADTRIIPGHGPLADRAALEGYREMLVKVRDRVRGAIDRGQSAAELVASGAFKDIEAQWGGGFLNTDKFINIVYTGLKGG